jgi:hypothetical protein
MKKDKLLTEALTRFKEASDLNSEQFQEISEQIKFTKLGDQWPDTIKRSREVPGQERPMLVVNRIQQFCNQVVNEIRKNKPSIKFRPSDDSANIKASEFRENLVRRIQNKSNIDIAVDTAADNQVTVGLGWILVKTDYESSDSFDQEICIERVPDVMQVLPGYYTSPDGSDLDYCFIVKQVNKDVFEAEYGEVDTKDFAEMPTGILAGWWDKNNIRIADYFYIERTNRTLVQLQDGSTAFKDELQPEQEMLITNERKVVDKKCKWCKIAGNKIIDKTEILTSFIPLVPVHGNEFWLNGKRYLSGLTKQAMDAQRMYNYTLSANAELNALAPKAPYIAAAGQLDGFEMEWANANKINVSVLNYNPVSEVGSLLPPPRRTEPVSSNPGLELAMNRSAEDIKATMGMYDASLGNREGEASGKAIQSQLNQAALSTYHFTGNLLRSLKHIGHIVNEMLSIYDVPKQVQGLTESGEPMTYIIDPNAPESYQEQQGPNGELIEIYNLHKGKFDIVVDVGPTYETKRQEAVDAQLQLIQTDPSLMEIAGDLIIKNMDWPGADAIAKRKKLMLPQQILQDEQKAGQEVDQEVEQKMNQMADMIEHLTQELKVAQDAPEHDKLDIERFNAQTKRLEVEHKIAVESTGLFHKIAMDSVSQTLAQPNTGELDDLDDNEPNEQQPGAMPAGVPNEQIIQ